MNLALIAPGPGDGTSFYRAVGPFSYLARETGLRLVTAAEWDWTNLMACDAVFLQRPFSQDHGMVAKWCQALHIPLWVDYDDLYQAFPDWTQVQQNIYGTPESKSVMKFCLETAEVVTVSTEGLRELSEKAVVIPNALNTYLWKMSDLPRQRIVTWRGSGGHMGDLDEQLGAIERVATMYPDWQFHWLGRPHYKCMKLGKVHPYRDLFSYMELFRELAPAVHIAPLADCRFNRCKSNIAWLEATAAGAVVVAPAFEEWVRPGVINYFGPSDFEAALRGAIEMEETRRAGMVNDSRMFIHEKLRLSVVNQERVRILEQIGKGK